MLATAVWRPVNAASSFLSDLIGPHLHGERRAQPLAVNVNWVVLLALFGAAGMLLIAFADGAGRRGYTYTSWLYYWSGLALVIFPIVARMAKPAVARSERIILLVLLTEFLFYPNILYSPTSFIRYDEMLHWMSAYGILHRHRLFLANSMLPVSPYFPGLELLTTAFANLAGVSIHTAAELVLAVLRAAFMVTLFLFFERLSGSARLAVIGCLLYMSSSTYIEFDASFAYESLAIVLFIMILLVEADLSDTPRLFILFALLMGAVAVTHHVTAIWCFLYLLSLGVAHSLSRTGHRQARTAVLFAAAGIAILVPLLWFVFVGDMLLNYLLPTIHQDLAGFLAKLTGESNGIPDRPMFVSDDGTVQPMLNRVVGVVSVLIVAIGLTTGFFRSLALSVSPRILGWRRLLEVLRRNWSDSRSVLLTLGAFLFPVAVILRLSGSGWEIGHRLSTFALFSASLVAAVAVVHFWQFHVERTRYGRAVLSLAIGMVVFGGVIVGGGSHPVHDVYRISGDADSIEPMGIDAARWTRQWLGEGNRFAADRVNQLLLGTYGQQHIITPIKNRVYLPSIFRPESTQGDPAYQIRESQIEYLLVDLRLTMGKAAMGEYYERGEPETPPTPSSLLKFDRDKRAACVFDNGWMMIYDVRHFND
jgi:hypothetical protein